MLCILAIIAELLMTSLIHLKPELVEEKIPLKDFQKIADILKIVIFVLYLISCVIAKFNPKSWWLFIALFVPGLTLFALSEGLLENTGLVLFGGDIDNQIKEFLLSLRHSLLIGALLLVLGLWCLFNPTYLLTSTTCAFVISILFHILLEEYPNK